MSVSSLKELNPVLIFIILRINKRTPLVRSAIAALRRFRTALKCGSAATYTQFQNRLHARIGLLAYERSQEEILKRILFHIARSGVLRCNFKAGDCLTTYAVFPGQGRDADAFREFCLC